MPDDNSTESICGYTRHPASAAIGENDHFQDLIDSMRDHGFDPRKPIEIVSRNQVIIGWHRLRASEIVGVDPVIIDHGDLSPDDIYVRVKVDEIDRRHLTPSQRAEAVVRLKRSLGQEFADPGQRSDLQPGSNEPGSISGRGTAEEASVSRATADRVINRVKAEERGDNLLDNLPPHLQGSPQTEAPPKPPRVSKKERLENQLWIHEKEIKGYLGQIKELEARVEDLTEELEHYKNVQAGYDAAAEGAEDHGISKSFETVNRMIAKNRSLTASVREQQHLRQQAERENKRFRKRLKELGEDIKV